MIISCETRRGKKKCSSHRQEEVTLWGKFRDRTAGVSLWWRLHNQALSEISGTHGFGCSTKIKSEDSWEVSKDWTAEASEKAKTLFQTTLNFKHCLLSVCFIYYIVLCETHRCKWAALLQFFILILMSINVNTKTNILQQLPDFSTNFGKDAALQTFLLFTFEKFS